jgi:hypothetical protein
MKYEQLIIVVLNKVLAILKAIGTPTTAEAEKLLQDLVKALSDPPGPPPVPPDS